MEIYVNIFDSKKLKDYVDIIKETDELEFKKKSNKYEELIIEDNIKPLLSDFFEQENRRINEDVFPKLKEAIYFITLTYIYNEKISKIKKIEFIKKHLPINKELFIDLINQNY